MVWIATVAEARRLEELAVEVEGALVDVNLTGAREDSFRNPMKLFGRLSALASDLNWKGADFRPTEQQRAVHAVLTERLEAAKARIDAFFGQDLGSINDKLREMGRPMIISEPDAPSQAEPHPDKEPGR